MKKGAIKMLKKRNRVLSLFLALVMSFALVVPAAAAGGGLVRLYVDGKDLGGYASSAPVELFVDGEKSLSEIKVTAEGAEAKVYTPATLEKTETITLPKGTQYQVIKSTNSDGYKEYHLKTLNTIMEDITVHVTSAKAQYNVYAKYGVYGQNNNNGGAESCTMDVQPVTTVDGGKEFAVTYTPVRNQEITHIKLAVDSVDGKSVLVPVTQSSGTVSGVAYHIAQHAGSVTVTFNVDRAMYVTALTENVKDRYSLTVSTDLHSKANVTNESLVAGATKDITFTPDAGWNIGSINIVDGGQSGSINEKGTRVTVNGHAYVLTRKLDGSAVLNVPAIKANVSVTVGSTTQTKYVNVETDRYTDSDEEGINYVSIGDPFTVTFEPDRDTMVMTISVVTPHGTYKAESTDGYLRLNGTYVPIYVDNNGNVTLQFRSVETNMTVQCSTRDTVHVIDVDTDRGIKSSYSYDTVNDGDDLDITFTPELGYEVKEIQVTYNGSTYKARPERDSYIRVDGRRWEISSGYNGVVTLYMTDIKHDVDVMARNRVTSGSGDPDETYRISISEDSHSNVDYTGSNPFDYDESTTISVTTDRNYIVDYIRFSMGGDSATITPFDTEFELDGETYQVDWNTNRDVEIYFDYLTDDLTVTARSERGSEEDYDGPSYGNYRISKTEDAHSNVSYTGSNPFGYNESTTVSVYTDRNYIVNYVRFSMGGKSVNVDPFDTSFTLGGNTYYVQWKTNADFSVYFPTLTGNLTINAYSERGTVKDYNGPTIPQYPDINVPSVHLNHQAYMAGYGNGYFGPNDNLSRAQALVVLTRLFSGLQDYDLKAYGNSVYYYDTPANAWYNAQVGYAKSIGALDIFGNSGYLKPNQAITRAEFVALMCRFTKSDVGGTPTNTSYRDVPAGHWASKFINYATAQGWISGYGNGYFGPNDSLTRAQICVMLNHATGRIAGGSGARYPITFKDVPAIHWAYQDICEATNSHTISGYMNGIEIWQ